MYKGKYEQKQPNAAPKAARVPTQEPQPAANETVVPQAVSQPAPHQPVPQQPATQRPAPQRRPAQRKRKKRVTRGTYIFYGVLLAIVLIFFIVMAIAMGALKNWLVNLQAAQPETASQRVFSQLFADPDWAELYALANPNDSSAGSGSACAAYMQEQIDGKELGFIETAAEPSGDRKYIVYYLQDGQTGVAIATFTLTADNMDAQIPDWRLGTVEIFFSQNLSYDIVVLPGHTVTVNGAVLDEGHIIRKVSTAAEDYLPDGIHGYQLQTYRVTELSAAPDIVVTDADGEAVELIYDDASKTYTQVMPQADAISDEEYDVVLSAAKAYSDYMIAGSYGLTKYFDTNSQIYKTITGGMVIRQKYSRYDFEEETISEYYRYSDDLFSAKINLIAKVTRKDGTVKEFEVDSTFIFDKSSGKWMVHDMLNVDIQEQITQVRLTYQDADGNEISSEFVDANTKRLTPPTVTVPEGQTFIGWYEETTDSQGNTTLTERFLPDEYGSVSVTTPLEPMVLVPQFKEAS